MPKAISPLLKADFEKALTGLDQKLAVGNGLYLHVRGGSSLWVLQYRDGASHRARSLGTYPDLSLYAARQAREDFAVARRGTRTERRGVAVRATADSASEPKAVTVKRMRFAAVLEDYLAVNSPQWKASNRENHIEKYRTLLKTPLASLWIDAITTADLETAFKPMTLGVAESHRMRIKLILDYAAAKGLRDKLIPNPAAKDILKHLIPNAPKSTPHKAMKSADVPAFFAELVADGSPNARALAFLILTNVRTNEARDIDWSEIDGNVWTVPGGLDGRMKEGEIHRVWLSPAAMALLGTPKKAGLVFGKLGEQSLMRKLTELRPLPDDVDPYKVHGLRTTFKGDWALRARYPLEEREMALGHAISEEKTKGYNLPPEEIYTVIIPMRQAWSDFVTSASIVPGT
jgi:integrase